MTNERKAFLLSPLLVPLIFVGGIAGFNLQFGLIDYLETTLMIGVFALPVAYLMELLFGFPIYLLFKKLNLVNIFTLSLGGVFVANIPLLIIGLMGGYDNAVDKFTAAVALFSAIGFLVGLTFWFVLNIEHITRRKSTPAAGRS